MITMNRSKFGKSWVILVVLVGMAALAACYFYSGQASAQKSAEAPQQGPVPTGDSHSAKSSDPIKQAIASLAYVDLHGSDLPPQKGAADYARAFNDDPERAMQEIQKRITLVPYEGSLANPPLLFEGGLANSLDRARVLETILKSAGIEARIVSAEQDGKGAFATYPATTPVKLPAGNLEILEALRQETQELSPAILAKLQKNGGGGSWATSLIGARMERRLYWVQYQRSEKWVDLVPEDSTITEGKRLSAQVLSPDALSRLVWQVKLTVTNSFAGNAAQQDILSFSAPAPDLNGAALTIFNQPDDSQKLFIPCLFYGDKKITGASFSLNEGKQELEHQLLRLDVEGPYETRHFERTLIGPKGPANNSERLLEIATLARITVVTTSLSDEQFKRSVVPNLIQSAKLVFGKVELAQNAPSANFVSVAAIAVLDGSHRIAGHIGAAAEQVLAFQGRPAVAMERDFVDVSYDALRRVHSFDIIDPGHSLYGPNAAKNTLIQAAIEQSVVDAWLEDRVTMGKNVLTSRGAVRELVTSQASLNIVKLPATIGGDKYGASLPAYRLAATSQTKAAGWRFDPGPQVVPVLWNYTGGTEAGGTSMARVKALCEALPLSMVFVPAEVFPQKFLVTGLVKYDCNLAKAYEKTAHIIGGIGQLISGEAQPNPDLSSDDLKKMIDELGPDLVTNILLGALGQSAAGLAVHAALGEESEEHSSTEALLRYLAGAGADFGADKAGERIKEYLNEVQQSLREGKSEAQIESAAAKESPLR
jgi:hypothetical protein